MATYTVNFYDLDPLGVITQTIGGTTTWTGPGTADGVATITDTETGVEEWTLDDDSAGGETATADVTLGASSSTGVNVDAEESGTVRDTVTGQIFQIVTFQVEGGGASGYYTLSEIPLVVGRDYETLAFSSNPDVTAGDPAFDYNDYVSGDGAVTGTSGADTIDSAYTGDPEGDEIDDGNGSGPSGNGNIVYADGGNDLVESGLGDDYVYGGTGNDTVEGGDDDDTILGEAGDDVLYGDNGDFASGGGDDSIDGGAGADTIYGEDGDDTLLGGDGDDSIEGGDGADSITGGEGDDTLEGGDGNDMIEGDGGIRTEVLDWSAEGPDNTDLSAGFTQTTGLVDVTVAFTDDGNNNPLFRVETTDTIYVEGGEEYDTNSSLYLYGDGDGATSTTDISFAGATGASVEDEVENVSFRISDIDWGSGNHQDVLTVNAFDADGNAVTVTITPAGNDTVSGNTITAGLTGEGPGDAAGSVLIEIAGPVQDIEIIYTNALNGTQAVWVSDVYFESIPTAAVSSDSIDGGAGNDALMGMHGDDTITGGTGNDTMVGGSGDDVFVLEDGSGADEIRDFDTGDTDGDGFFNDQIDVTNLTDSGGNPVDAWDVVVSDDGSGNALLTFPNGETLLLRGVTPAEMTGAQNLNSAGIPCANIGTLVRTPDGEVPIETLKVGDMVETLDNGPQEVLWIGTRHLSAGDLEETPQHRPIFIPEGLFGNFDELFVSPQHGMFIGRDQVGREVFARAKHLAETPGPVRVAKGKKRVTYFHLMFAEHQVIFENGAATESFYPGPQTLKMFEPKVIAELKAVIPELGNDSVETVYGPPARPYLKRHEVLAKIALKRDEEDVAKAAA